METFQANPKLKLDFKKRLF